MPDTALNSELQAVFVKYKEAFATYDGARIANFYYIPTVAVRIDGPVKFLQSSADLESFFQTAVDSFRKDGYVDGKFENFTVLQMGEECVLATIDWTILRNDGTAIRKWRQSYNLVRVNRGWKMLVSTMHALSIATAA